MTRKRKDYRELKVSSFSGYGYKSAPMLRIQGLWLEELGFNIGDALKVSHLSGACSGRFLVLPPLTLVALHGEQKYLMRSLPSFIF